MARLIYSPIASLDGYIEDEQGKFDWAAPDDEVHPFVNDLERPVNRTSTRNVRREIEPISPSTRTVDDTSATAPLITRFG